MNAVYITLNDMRRIWLQPLVWILLELIYLFISFLLLLLLSIFINEIQQNLTQ